MDRSIHSADQTKIRERLTREIAAARLQLARLSQENARLKSSSEQEAGANSLRRHEWHTCDILESMTDAFYAVDDRWRLTYVNRKAAELWGRPRKGLIGQVIWNLFPNYEQSLAYRQHRRAMEKRVPVSYEAFSDNLKFWAEVNLYPTADGGISVYFRDITKRKRAQEALQESERRFRAVFEVASVGIVQVNPSDGRFIDCNEKYCQITGYSREELAALSFSDLTHPDDRRDDWQLFVRSVDGETANYLNEKRYLRKDGSIIWVRLNAGYIRNGDGRAARTVAICEDITERKQAEQALLDSEAQKRLALEAGHLGIWKYNPQTRETHWDQRSRQLFGVSAHEPIDLDKFLSIVHPDDLGRMRKAIAIGLDPSTGSDFLESQYRILLPNGEVRWISANGKRYTATEKSDNKVVRIIGTQMDITARKLAEEKLRNSEADKAFLLKLSDALRPLSDPLEIQGEAARVLGEQLGVDRVRYVEIESGKDGDYYVVRQGYRQPDVKGFLGRYRAADFGTFAAETLRAGRTLVLDNARFDNRLDEQARTAYLAVGTLAAVTVPLIKAGRHIAAIAVHQTSPRAWTADEIALVEETAERTWAAVERARAEDHLRRMNESLEQQISERTDLAENRARQLQALAVELIEAEERERQRIAVLLHEDLQQLLAAARFTLQSKRRSDPDIRETQGLLEEAIGKSRRLSHELSPPVLHHSGLTASLQWLCLHMREQFNLDVELDMQTPRQVESALLRVFIFRAVQELLFNIVKHAGVQSARVEVAESGHELIVTVSDPGQGFDTSILETYKPKAGLGLLSLRERTSYIGGRLVIESAPGQGSRLTLGIPARMDGASAQDLPAAPVGQKARKPVSASLPSDADAPGIRVLFADDHKVMRQGLIRLVSGKPDISVVGEAANGREALDLARRLRPDVVIMDVSMPVMDGIEATRQIVAEMPNMRVIGLSMHEDDHVSMAMRGAGAEAFLSKATSSAELLKAIYATVRRREASPRKEDARRPSQLNFPWQL